MPNNNQINEINAKYITKFKIMGNDIYKVNVKAVSQ